MKSMAASQEAAQAPSDHWRWRTSLEAPHRLAFFLALLVLAVTGLCWAAVQLDRAGAGLGLRFAVSATVTHSAVMVFGFLPLFFSGFLFTAGPRWLGVPAPSARQLLASLSLYTTGWLLWLLTAHVHVVLAAASLLLALAGLVAITLRFWHLVLASRAPDRVHAKTIGTALAIGCICLTGLTFALLLDAPVLARAFVLSALWGFLVVVFATVAHRMIPFFTASTVPMVNAWRPFWVLWLMLSIAVFEAAAVWVESFAAPATPWLWFRGGVELPAAGLLIWLVFAWGLLQSLRVRLLAMLHLGFLWLGLGLGLSALSQLTAAATGTSILPLAALHAVTIGCLASLMLAMVTRVSCGHSGRPLVADNVVWLLFWLLQATALLRIAATVPAAPMQDLLVAAAVLWTALMLVWGLRYGSWYGRARADGQPG
jgi:uncharacterized protein involved in response to NO